VLEPQAARMRTQLTSNVALRMKNLLQQNEKSKDQAG